jgi:ERCC4-type nuclease
MPVKYILDTREKGLQELFTKNNVQYDVKQLDLGDILILYSKTEIVNLVSLDSNESKLLKEESKQQESPVFTFIIERKSYTDLKASMGDNRYHEQKSRYMQVPQRTMYYIFENNDPNFKELGKKQFLGAYIHTMIRDGLGVFLTNSQIETYEYIIKIGDTLEKFGFQSQDSKEDQKSSMASTQIKKKKASGQEVYKQQLCCIPGISSGKADLIINQYPNMTVLLESIKDESFKVKGIGKVLFDKIKESFIY